MLKFKTINRNPAEQQVHNFMAMANAFGKQQFENGDNSVKFMSAKNAKEQYTGVIKTLVALANPASENHNKAYNALTNELKDENGGIDRDAINHVESLGKNWAGRILDLAQNAQKQGIVGKDAIAAAYNTVAGNPVFDQFVNVNMMSDQLFEEQVIVESFLDNGDAFAVPVEAGNTGTASSRFRVPVRFVTGSPKTYQGDINPTSHMRDDASRLQENLSQEFKDAKTLSQPFSITQDQRNQVLGFAKSINPALGGFILQSYYSTDAINMIMKDAELQAVDGTSSRGVYTPGVGGDYGLLSSSIQFHLSDWDTASPAAANGADFAANPNALIQKIQNFNAKPTSITAPLPSDLDIAKVYQDLVRLFGMPVKNNVDFQSKQWTLIIPTSAYQLFVQYGTSGTFNKKLLEMAESAGMGKVFKNIKIIPSSLFDYRATNAYGSTASAFNYMMLMPQGSPNGKKAMILPGQTSLPVVVSQHTNAQIMDFQTLYVYGGPMVTQLGGVYILEWSKAA